MKRTEQSFKNLKVSVIGQCVNFAISFILRTVVIMRLGAEYLGVLGTFGDIFRILSLAELGFANVLNFRLYRPVALKDEEKIAATLNYFGNAYRKIGCVVAAAGLLCLPLLPHVLTGVDNIQGIPLFYILCLANTVISYFYAYKKSIIIANQEAYITSRIEYAVLIIQDIIQIIVVFVFNSFTLYLAVQLVSTLIQNLLTSGTAGRRYPYINNRAELGVTEKKDIRQDVFALFGYRIGSVIIASTDSLIISKFISTAVVGVYSNYLLITTALNSVIMQIFDACRASLGNLNVLESEERKYEVYRIMAYISFWVYGLCSIGIYCFINPLFQFMWGPEYILSKNVLAMVALQFYLLGMMKNVSELYINALGLFQHVKMYPLIGAAVNIVVSLIGVQKLGLFGVFLGTVLSFAATYFWAWPYVVFRKGIHQKLGNYYKLYFKYSAITLLTVFICDTICERILVGGILNFFAVGVSVFLLINIIFALFTYRTMEFQWVLGNAKRAAAAIQRKVRK